ncbi:MAG: polysaccharide ABC transporter ATP-binding protein [Paludibacteraceae bacterium]|nr:polysaccharide ABC transporter ATP-binding protein [Paludibacteraceae bacterium]
MNAIEFDHVSKQYRLGLVSTKTLSHDIRRFWITNVLGKEDPYLKIGETNDRASKGNSEYVWALKDITFNVEQGDVVGIIGKNGAGKSTLLKLLSRVTGPTTGQIRAHGRIGSLLEVGTGFHQEMTGRENIFMNGAILGMTRSEIQRKLDEIVDFSGCERYIDTPVKRYSSGMMVRLGFAVAAHLDPEILVVDEVLAVGDAEFQKKAIGKMQDVSKGEGRTVLFVSHNMASIKQLCKTGIVLNQGRVDFTGTANEAVDFYLSAGHNEIRELKYSQTDAPREDGVLFLSGQVYADKNDPQGCIYTTDDIHLEFEFFNENKQEGQYDVTFFLYDEMNNEIFCTSSYGKQHIVEQTGEGMYHAHCVIPKNLLNFGTYRVGRLLFLRNDSVLMERKDVLYFEITKLVIQDCFGYIASRKEGLIHPILDWSVSCNDQITVNP